MGEHDPFLQMLAAYSQAVLDKNVDAFVALYDEQVHVFDMWGAWSLEGIGAWRAMASDWFASLGEEQVRVTYEEVTSVVNGDLAVGHAVLTYTAVAASGETLRSLDNRITLAMKRHAGVWTIFHEHTSAPIEHVTMKAILQRQARQ